MARGLVKRAITRVVTPGTIIEPSMLEESANNFLAAVVGEGSLSGPGLVDVSTGEFLTTEIPFDGLASSWPASGLRSGSRPLPCIRRPHENRFWKRPASPGKCQRGPAEPVRA